MRISDWSSDVCSSDLRDWQATHHTNAAPQGLTLLFPMNDLFEEYIAALLRRGLVGSDIQVTTQGGLRHCLGDFVAVERLEKETLFQTPPDIILRRGTPIVQINHTKWQQLQLQKYDRATRRER